MSDANRVAIVGGGLAGLAAACYAARAGASVQVFESLSQPGGRARTRDDGGYLFNMGPHALYLGSCGRPVLDELGVELRGGSPELSSSLARLNGELHALPAGFVSLITSGLLGLGGKLEIGRLLASLPRLDTSPLNGVSLAEALDRMLSNERARQLVRGLVRLTSYTNAPDIQSAGSALDQLRTALDGVRYLDGGWQSLVDGLVSSALESGVKIHRGRRVRSVVLDAGVRGLSLDDGDIEADTVVLAMGPAEASALVASGSDPTLCEWAESSVPVRAASLEIALTHLPVPRKRFCLGIDEPFYFSVHSGACKLAPGEGVVLHVARYLEPGEKPERTALEAQLESVMDSMQPGWRDALVAKKLLNDLRVSHAVVSAGMGGLSGRPGPAVEHVNGLYVAGDWVGNEGQLADASLASGKRAGLAAAASAVAGTRAA